MGAHKSFIPRLLESILTENENRVPQNITLIPKVALGYVPFAFFLMFLFSVGSGGFGGYYIFIYSGLCLVILLPIYSVYLVFLTWQRYKKGTLTSYVFFIHLLSFIVPLLYLLQVITLNGSPAWLKTEVSNTRVCSWPYWTVQTLWREWWTLGGADEFPATNNHHYSTCSNGCWRQ